MPFGLGRSELWSSQSPEVRNHKLRIQTRKSRLQGFVLTFVGNIIQSWNKKCAYTSAAAINKNISFDWSVNSWQCQMLSSCKDQYVAPTFFVWQAEVRMHFPEDYVLYNCTSLALSMSVSYWIAEWGVKSCATFEDALWSCRNLSDSQQRSSQTYRNLWSSLGIVCLCYAGEFVLAIFTGNVIFLVFSFEIHRV